VVVLNYNGLKHLESCFNSLLALDYPANKLELMLVDNASRDESVAYARERFPRVRVVETGANLGFAGGNNFGAREANGDWVAFLNNDTRVEPEWLLQMVKTTLAGEERGLVCVSSLMLDWAGKRIDFQAGALNFHGFGFQPSYGLPVEGREIKPRELLFPCGGSMLIKREVFLEVGGFDDDFFAFFEDVDLGWRLWLLGYRVELVPSAVTYHRHHGSFESVAGHRNYLLYERNALYAIYKNYEQETLDKALPAALLLLGQRAARFMEMSGVDFDEYDLEMGGAQQPPTDTVHRNAVAALLAVEEFSANLESMKEKRAWIQANRRRTDAELFARFERPGHANLWNHSSDATYATAHHTIVNEFGLSDLWSDVPKEVLVISPDVLPVGEIPATGSGIRAWALGKGLESRGHKVRFTMPAPAIAGREHMVPDEYARGAWTTQNLQSMIDAAQPDVVVTCGWPNLTWVERANLPVAVDLTGPHVLERAYQGHRDPITNSAEKRRALQKGDFYSCIGERQRLYFYGWLLQSGVNAEELEERLAVIPYSVDPELPEHVWRAGEKGRAAQAHEGVEGGRRQRNRAPDTQFVFGGVFLPWQNPAPALLTVAETLTEVGKGRLHVIGGKHPFYPVETESFGPMLERLSRLPQVTISSLMPHDELVEIYKKAQVAVDVFQPNPERELAFPSRTVHYLWCGLPVIHASFSEVADHIREYDAGWIVPHDDREALRAVVHQILADPSLAEKKGRNAQRLASDRFTWDQTIEALDRFIRKPDMRGARGDRRALRFTEDRPQAIEDVSSKRRNAQAERQMSRREVRPLTPELQKLQSRRRSPAAQVAARSLSLLREFVPIKGGRAKARYKNGRSNFLLPELIAGHSHGFRFLCPGEGLCGVGVRVGTLGRRNTARLTLHLREHPAAQSDLAEMEVAGHELKDGEWVMLRFPRMSGSEGRWFYLVAESPDGAPGDAVTLWGADQVEGLAGQRYEDGLPASGALIVRIEVDGGTI
jgi:GT2 family glycosyltransferase/glycosyltransferase involved in cell wall biosynthesis